jgi:hypothetical protein
LPGDNQEQVIGELRKRIQFHRWTLVLGSGVSNSLGIPMWRPLALGLVEDIFGGNGRARYASVTKALEAWIGNPLVLVRQLETILGYRSEMLGILRQRLYAKYHQRKERLLLEPICRLLLLRGRRSTRHVITYNFDNTLERCLHRLGCDTHSVWSEETFADSRRTLRVYHPHGFLPHPEDDSSDRFLDESIVFSERDYHTQYMRGNTWVDSVHLHHYMSRTCLFVGLSLSDPNMRRLLDHVRILRLPPRIPCHFAIQKLGNSKVANHLLAMQLESLGVQVIWVRRFADIPSVIEECCR